MLSQLIINNIKKYLYIPTIIGSIPKDIVLTIIKYNPKIVKYLSNEKLDLSINWEKLYYFLYQSKHIPLGYNYPKKFKNIYLNAIINIIFLRKKY